MCLVTLDNKLYLSPLDENIKRVLDVGTGAGTWAIEFGLFTPQPFFLQVF